VFHVTEYKLQGRREEKMKPTLEEEAAAGAVKNKKKHR